MSIPARWACAICSFLGMLYNLPSLRKCAPVCLKWNTTFDLMHDVGVLLKLRIAPIHIAMLTALALLMASMPQVPQLAHNIYYFANISQIIDWL